MSTADTRGVILLGIYFRALIMCIFIETGLDCTLFIEEPMDYLVAGRLFPTVNILIFHHTLGERASQEGFDIAHVRLQYRLPRRTVARTSAYFRVLGRLDRGVARKIQKRLSDTHASSTADTPVKYAYGIGKSCRTRLFLHDYARIRGKRITRVACGAYIKSTEFSCKPKVYFYTFPWRLSRRGSA